MTAKDAEISARKKRDSSLSLIELNGVYAEHIKEKIWTIEENIRLVKYHNK